MITMEESAASLDGNEYCYEGSPELFARMKESRLVAVYGLSDDIMKVDGVYRQWNGKYLYSTQPFRLSAQPLVVTVKQ